MNNHRIRNAVLIVLGMVAVTATAHALTQTYRYINSDNGVPIGDMSQGNMGPRAAIRCWAMSSHASAGHNYWSCQQVEANGNMSCRHSPTPTSGARELVLWDCHRLAAGAQCDMRVRNAAGTYDTIGYTNWSDGSPGERWYHFNDGGSGKCNVFNGGTGFFEYYSP